MSPAQQRLLTKIRHSPDGYSPRGNEWRSASVLLRQRLVEWHYWWAFGRLMDEAPVLVALDNPPPAGPATGAQADE